MKKIDLHGYAVMNRVDELRAAITEGVNLNEKDRFGATALHSAIAYKNLEVIALLLEHGAEVTAQDKDGSTPLHYAIEHNLHSVAEALVKRNPAVIVIADKHGNQPLWTAAFNARGSYETVSMLLGYGADPNHVNKTSLSPLDLAKRIGEGALLRILESAKLGQSKGQE
jgi:ankyrin repeat protein